MFCPEKNSYLQLVCAVEPRVINRAVERAMSHKAVDFPCHDDNLILPITCKCAGLTKDGQPDIKQIRALGLKSAQPSTYAPQVDVTRARLGFGRVGLRLINRDLHSTDYLIQLQALNSVMDQVASLDLRAQQLMPSTPLPTGHQLFEEPRHDKKKTRKYLLPVWYILMYHSARSNATPASEKYSFVSNFFKVQISENALFLLNINVVHRLTDLLDNIDPIIREKVCLILTHLAGYYQGRQRLSNCPNLYFRLMWLCLRDKREIRYAAAYTLRTLSRDRCASEAVCKVDGMIENLLRVIKNEYTGIVLIHLKTLKNLFEYDPVVPLKENAFQIMLQLFYNDDPRIVSEAMECMSQLCKHDVGKLLADEYDLTFVLRPYLTRKNYDVVISAVGLMCYTTLTTRSKWRAREVAPELTRNLTYLSHAPTIPLLQLRTLQVLINLCDHPDIRKHIKTFWKKKIILVTIRNHEQWDGTVETTSMGLETGHNYRTMCIEDKETIKNDYGDNAEVVNVHSFLRTIQLKKCQLLRAIDWQPYS